MISALIGFLGRASFAVTKFYLTLLGIKEAAARPYFLFKERTSPPLGSRRILSFGGMSGSQEKASLWPALPLSGELKNASPSLLIEGCDNGIVCLSDFDTAAVYLWNPLLNHLKKLPPPPEDNGGSPGFRVGLVHNPASDDLAVVRLSRAERDGDLPKGFDAFGRLFTRDTLASVYSLRRNSWRSIPFPPLLDLDGTRLEKAFPNRKCSVVVLGRVHWSLIYLTADPQLFPKPGSFKCHSYGIVAFDPNTEAFTVINPPVGPDHVKPLLVNSIGKLGGCLSLVCSPPELGRCDVWVMKEYGVAGSWTKQVSVDCVFVPKALQPYYTASRRLGAIGVTSTGHVLFSILDDAGLFWYNIETRAFEYCCPAGNVGPFITEYVPTVYGL